MLLDNINDTHFWDFTNDSFTVIDSFITTLNAISISGTEVTIIDYEDQSYFSGTESTWASVGYFEPNLTDNETCEPPFGFEQDPITKITISLVVSILAIVTSLGNLLVLISFHIDPQLQTISNYFLLSLAVADFAIGIISIPLYSMYILLDDWPLGVWACDTWLSLDYTASNASVANLIVISVDRYLSITRPLTYRARRTSTKAAFMIAGVWTVSALLWTPWIFAWPYFENGRTVPECHCSIQFQNNKYMVIGTSVAAFYLPVLILCVLYWKIYMETEKRRLGLALLQATRQTAYIIKEDESSDAEISNNHNNPQCTDNLDTPDNLEDIPALYDRAFSRQSQPRQPSSCWDRCRNFFRIDREYSTDLNQAESSSCSEIPPTPGSISPHTASSLRVRRLSIGTICQTVPEFPVGNEVSVRIGRSYSEKNRRPEAGIDRGRNSKRNRLQRMNEGFTGVKRGSGGKDGRKRSSSISTLRELKECGNSEEKRRESLQGSSRNPVILNNIFEDDRAPQIIISENPETPVREQFSALHRFSANDQMETQKSEINDNCFNIQSGEKSPFTNEKINGNICLNSDTTNKSINESTKGCNSMISEMRNGTGTRFPNANSNKGLQNKVDTEINSELKFKSDERPKDFLSTITECNFNSKSSPSSPTVDAQNRQPRSSSLRQARGSVSTQNNKSSSLPPELKANGKSPQLRWKYSEIYTRPSSTKSTASSKKGSQKSPPPLEIAMGSRLLLATAPLRCGAPPSSRLHSRPQDRFNARKARQRRQEKRQDQKAAKTLTAILLVFIITWTPYHLFSVIGVFCPDCINPKLFALGYWLCYINSTINPLCYALCNANFRNTYWRILKCHWRTREVRRARALSVCSAPYMGSRLLPQQQNSLNK